jgi:hypothetical protein
MLGREEDVSGLPLEYILGESRRNISEQFYNLQAEETLSSLEATDISQLPQASSTALIPEDTDLTQLHSESLKGNRDNLKLDIEESKEITYSSLVFSPGGNEAYVFSTAGLSQQDEDAAKVEVSKQTRVCHSLTFLLKHNEDLSLNLLVFTLDLDLLSKYIVYNLVIFIRQYQFCRLN